MKHFIYGALAIGVFSLNSCQKEDEVKCILPSTSMSINSPAIIGESIYLTTPDYRYESNVTFEWTGPNNFFSNEQNPVIPKATSNMNGDYSLTIKKGICATKSLTTLVEVINNPASCVQKVNSGVFTNIDSYNFYNFSMYSNSNDTYTVKAGEYQMNIELTFAGSDKPKQGVYSITNKSTSLSKGGVYVKAINTGYYSNYEYFGLKGEVLVTYNNFGQMTIKFCSIPFGYGSQTTTITNGSVNFIVTR